jgi:pyridoxine 5-phosphate synthase
MTVLSVNLNKVALLRNQRDLSYPNLLDMARTAIAAGAGGITVHPRPDERHIRKSDVRELAQMLKSEYPGTIEFNVEGYPSQDFMALVEAVRPHQVTLVPDAPGQSTSDHGWDIPKNMDTLCTITSQLHKIGARVALFVDDDPAMAEPAKATGTDRVELYTGPYHFAFAKGQGSEALKSFKATAEAMRSTGLELNAGHDLNLENLPKFLSTIPFIEEVSIGHALTVDALNMGMDAAVRSYVSILKVA